MPVLSIFSRFLDALEVPYTAWYSDDQFKKMTFKSLYGLSHLLTEYGVRNQAVKFADKQEITSLATPFLAQTKAGIFVIVLDIANSMVTYDSRGEILKIDLPSFLTAWNGIALLAFPNDKSREPEYSSHKLTEIISRSSKYALAAAAIFIFGYFFITRELYAHLSSILLTIFNCAGLWFSYMLVQKSLNIHTKTSDKVCGALEKGGCDSIMELKVSKLFGVFSWSEVGFGYFGVSLATLLVFPHLWPALAICNICCLPYTFWSIWYQKFRAKHWCTLCVAVQSTLWALFFCYLGGGWLAKAWPPHPSLLALLLCYLCAVLSINFLLGFFSKLPCHEKHPAA